MYTSIKTFFQVKIIFVESVLGLGNYFRIESTCTVIILLMRVLSEIPPYSFCVDYALLRLELIKNQCIVN